MRRTRRSDRIFFGALLVVVGLVWGLTGAILLSADAQPTEDDPGLGMASASLFAAAAPATSPPVAVPEIAARPSSSVPTSIPRAPQRSAPKVAPALVKVGEIEIPKIGLRHVLYEGVDLSIIDHGPGHWPGAALPGEAGNVVFAGHRVTHSRPFHNLDQLVAGDRVIFNTAAGSFTYEMTEQLIVFPKDVWIANPTPNATMTLFACHPKGSAQQRIVVRGNLVSAERISA
ncbi:MAG: class E sortase [Acidimicrobiia bacterium]